MSILGHNLISGGQRCVSAFAQRAGERGGQTQQSRGRERAAQAEDHRGGDFQTGTAQRAGEDQRGERIVMEQFQLIGKNICFRLLFHRC